MFTRSRFKLLLHISILVFFAPLCVVQWVFIYLKNWRKTYVQLPEEKRKTLMMTGASIQALQLARVMGQAGHKVIIVNKGFDVMTILTGFSKYVHKFYMVPTNAVYQDHLEEIWSKEKVDWFLPMNLSTDDLKFIIVMDFKAMEKVSNFSSLSVNSVFLAETLQSNAAFLQKCQTLGLPTILDLGPDCNVGGLDCDVGGESKNHVKCGANVISKNGKLCMIQAWSVEKLVRSKIIYHQNVLEWVEHFAECTNLSGMLSFEFVINNGDQAFCSGCKLKLNPVISSFSDEAQSMKLEEVVRHALSNEEEKILVQDLISTKPTQRVYWLIEELISFDSFDTFLDIIQHGQEILWRDDDMFPFVMFYLLSPVLMIKHFLTKE